MAIARFPSIVLDGPDAAALATFYGALLDWEVDSSADWADVRSDYGQCLSFQQVEGYAPPAWPGQELPQPGTTFRVFLDPAGHPFCLCVD